MIPVGVPREDEILLEMRIYDVDRQQAIKRICNRSRIVERIEADRRRSADDSLEPQRETAPDGELDWMKELEPEPGHRRSRLDVALVSLSFVMSAGVVLTLLDVLLMYLIGLECLTCK